MRSSCYLRENYRSSVIPVNSYSEGTVSVKLGQGTVEKTKGEDGVVVNGYNGSTKTVSKPIKPRKQRSKKSS